QFLVNLLPGPQSGDPDIDVLRVTQTAQLDHPDREVVDPDQLSDVEDEDFAALAHRAGEQDQLASFRYGHKIPRDLPVGDRHRSTLFDLFFEGGDDRAVGAEDVAKPGHDKPGRVQVVQVGYVKFGHAFGSAHDVGRIDRLIGGHLDELFHAVLHRHLGYNAGALDVVADGFVGMAFHQGDVFVRRGVEDDLGFVVLE